MRLKKAIALAALVAIAFAIHGCASVQGEWEAARALDTPEGYDQFAKKHAGHTLADSAQARAQRIRAEAMETEWEAIRIRRDIAEIADIAVGRAGTERGNRAMDMLRRLITERGVPLSEEDTRLVMERVVDPIRSQYKQYAGNLIFQTEVNETFTSEVMVHVSAYSERLGIAHFKSITIRGLEGVLSYDDVGLLAGRLYTLAPAER